MQQVAWIIQEMQRSLQRQQFVEENLLYRGSWHMQVRRHNKSMEELLKIISKAKLPLKRWRRIMGGNAESVKERKREIAV